MIRIRRKINFLIYLFFVFSAPFFVYADEDVVIGTYHPSPYGVYNEVRLYPHSAPVTTCISTSGGTMFFNSTDGELKVCDGLGNWIGSVSESFWAASGNDIYNINTGNVGIGVTAPSAKLEINGSVSFSGVTEGYNGGITVPNSDLAVGGGTDGIFSVRSRNSGARMITLGNQTSGAGGTPATLAIDNLNRRVGIGTNSPAYTFHIYGDAEIMLENDNDPNKYGDIHFNNNPSGGSQFVIGNFAHGYPISSLRDAFFIRDAVPNRLFILNRNGNFGIGSSDPEELLHLRSDTQQDIWVEGNSPDMKIVDLEDGWDSLSIGLDSNNGNLRFTRNGKNTATSSPNTILATLMVITPAGRIGIGGVTSPSQPVVVQGGAFCNGNKWMDASDRAYKKNINYDFKYGFKAIEKLKPVYYIYKDDKTNKKQIGFIAQDVKNVIPEIVEGKEGALGLSYGQVSVALVNVIKEQQRQIEELKKDFNKLNAELTVDKLR